MSCRTFYRKTAIFWGCFGAKFPVDLPVTKPFEVVILQIWSTFLSWGLNQRVGCPLPLLEGNTARSGSGLRRIGRPYTGHGAWGGALCVRGVRAAGANGLTLHLLVLVAFSLVKAQFLRPPSFCLQTGQASLPSLSPSSSNCGCAHNFESLGGSQNAGSPWRIAGKWATEVAGGIFSDPKVPSAHFDRIARPATWKSPGRATDVQCWGRPARKPGDP